MTNQESIFDSLNAAIGPWSPNNSEAPIDFPADESLPWPTIEERDFPVATPVPNRDSIQERPIDDIGPRIDQPGGNEANILGGAIQVHGMEALAFYKSFRHRAVNPYPGKWGIFYLEKGLTLVGALVGIDTLMEPIRAKQLGFEFLRSHETFHYVVDLLALGVECPLVKHLYLPFRHAYLNCGSRCVEEALANQRAWKWAKKQETSVRGLASFAEQFMGCQPNAYQRYGDDPQILAAEMAANLIDQRFGTTGNAKLAGWMRAFPSNLATRWIPEYIIQGKSVAGLFRGVPTKPPVLMVIDSPRVKNRLATGDQSLSIKWDRTKRKLQACSSLGGLKFEKWEPKPGEWTVRVDDGFRAHLMQRAQPRGAWEAIKIGTHDEMDH